MSTDYKRARRHILDEDLLPDSEYKEQLRYQNSGRQIVQTAKGNWLFASISDFRFIAFRTLKLTVSEPGQIQGGDMPEAISLVGIENRHYPTVLKTETDLGQVLLHLDDKQQLHVFYNDADGIHVLRADASGDGLHAHLSEADSWTHEKIDAPAGAVPAEIICHANGSVELFYEHDKAIYSMPIGSTATKIAEDARRPSAHIDKQGVTHLAYEQMRIIYYLKRETPDSQWTNMTGGSEPEQAAQFCASWPSIATTDDGTVLIAYQGEGKFDLRKYKPLYGAMRAAGGSAICYTYYRDGRWHRKDIVRSCEAMLKRRPHHRNPQKDPQFKPFMEELWRPSLSIDKHGVLWVLWVNSTRRHIYYSRFLGDQFDQHYEARGAYEGLERTLFVQKDATQTDHIAFATSAHERLYFDAIMVPSINPSSKHRVTMIDNLDISRMRNLEHCLGKWDKDPKPHWGWGISGTSPDDNPAWAEVYKTDEGFELHYMSVNGENRTCTMRGRCFSKDGLTWEDREPLDESKITIDGELLTYGMWRPLYLRDDAEPDPQKRYKGLHFAWKYNRDVEVRFYQVVTSPDGLNWDTHPDLELVCTGDISVPSHLFKDDEDPDPRRRYKFMACTGGQSGRCVAMFSSPDLINWSHNRFMRDDETEAQSGLCPYPTGPTPIDADGGEYPWEEEIHDAYAWRENGIMMYHYDSFYFGANQHVQKALAVSRDGRQYHRVHRGQINLPNGAVGDWDSGRVRTSVPIRVGDELWMYFVGMPASFFDDPDDPNYVPPMWANAWGAVTEGDRQVQRPWRMGRAKLRVDGWGYMQLARDAEQGELVSLPIEMTEANRQLLVNAVNLGEGGLRIALLDGETCQPLVGFGYDASQFDSSEGVSVGVSWGDNRALPTGSVRVAFRFDGLRSKLYSFGFGG